MQNTYTDKQICLRPGGIAKCFDVSRTTVYEIANRYHLIHKLGSCSLIFVAEFEDAVRKEAARKETEKHA